VREFEVRQTSVAALRTGVLKVAGARVSFAFAVPAEAGLRRQVGEACGWAGFNCYGM
jgi:hypothetical protein